MSIIHTLPGIDVIKKDNRNYSIQADVQPETLLFWKSLPYEEFKEDKIHEKTTSTQKIIEFYAQSVQTLGQFLARHSYRLSYQQLLKLLKNVGDQLLYLERNAKTILFFSLEDIIVVNNSFFIFINSDKVYDVSKEGKVEIMAPLEVLDNSFFSPELDAIKSIPTRVPYQVSYFSFASLLTFCLTKQNVLSVGHQRIKHVLQEIYYTKLYWFLLRCFFSDATDRVFLFL